MSKPGNTMWKFVQLVFWLIVLVYITKLKENLDARDGAVHDALVDSLPANQAQGESEVPKRESTR